MNENRRNNEGTRKTLQIDVAKYQAMLDAPDLSEEQKRQFIEALWQVIVAFVDLGFQVHPVQQACGKKGKAASENPAALEDVVRSAGSPTTDFSDATEAERDERA